MSGLLSVGVSGLKAYQAQLQTTGNNVANATVEGYSRQRVTMGTSPSVNAGVGYLGTGVTIQDVERIANEYLEAQMQSDRSVHSDLSMQRELVSQLDELLAAESTGLATRMQAFFNALESASQDPGSIPVRQLVISEAEALVNRLQTIYARVDDVRSAASSEIESAVSQVNQKADTLAKLNQDISVALGKGYSPNDLLDERDRVLSELAELISIQTVEQNDGSLNVFIGSGQSLVVGQSVSRLDVIRSPSDPTRVDVVRIGYNANQVITDSITGGQIGGALTVQREVIDEALSTLGIIGLAIADQINQAQKRGLDLNGVAGVDLFSDVNSVADQRIIVNTENTSPISPEMSVTVSDVSLMTASNYELVIPDPLGGTYEITRLSDGVVVAQGAMPGERPFELNFDGLTLHVRQGVFNSQDRFMIDATSSYLQSMQVVMKHPESLAFASPLEAVQFDGNSGVAEVVDLTTLDGYEDQTNDRSLLVEFTSPTRYRILDYSDPLNPKSLNPPLENLLYIPGEQTSLFANSPTDQIYVSDGINAGAISLSAQATGGDAPQNRIINEQLSLAYRNENGVLQYTQTIDVVAGDQASTIAARLNALEGVTAKAVTEVSIYLDDSGDGIDSSLVVNGVALTGIVYDDDAIEVERPIPMTHDYLTDLINQDADLKAMGIQAYAEDGGIKIVSSVGDDIVLEFYGDENDRLLVGQDARPQLKTDVAINVPIDLGLEGSANNFTFDIDVGFGSQPVVVAGRFETADEAALALESAIGNALQDPDLVSVSVEDGRLVLTQTRLGVDQSIQISNLNNDPFGFETAQAQGAVSAGEVLELTGQNSPDNGLSVAIAGSLQVSTRNGVTLSSDAIGAGNLFSHATEAISNFTGFNFALGGSPNSDDKFIVRTNTSVEGDNRNLLTMIRVKDASVVGGAQGLRSISDYYGVFVEEIGSKTNQVATNQEAAQSILNQSQALRESISGVNLDEEAANLVLYQQAYGASSRVISVARDLFNQLLEIF